MKTPDTTRAALRVKLMAGGETDAAHLANTSISVDARVLAEMLDDLDVLGRAEECGWAEPPDRVGV